MLEGSGVRFLLQTERKVLASIVFRVAAGVAGAMPALLALAWLDRAAFGHAMVNYAWAMLLTGPVARFIGQGYLRDLLTRRTQDLTTRPPKGSIYIHLYALACMTLICAVAFCAVVTWVDAGFIMANLVIIVIFRVQESWFVAQTRQTAAILLFYLIPPLLHVVLIILVKPLAAFDQFSLVATTQVVGQSVSVVASVVMQSSHGRRFLVPYPPRTLLDWSTEFAAARQFFASGALLAATEQLPVILLNAFGFRAVIPVFEVARKLASVPEVLIHALNMHLMPRLVSCASSGEWSDFRRVLRVFTLTAGGLSCRYIAVAAAGLYALSTLSPHALQIDFPIFAILFSAAVVTSFFAPLGSVVTVLQGDIWWTIGGGASLAIQFAVSLFAMTGLGAIAIPLSVLAQVLVLRAITTVGAVLLLAKREKVNVWRTASP